MMGFPEWKKQFCSKRKEFLRWGKTKYGRNKIYDYVFWLRYPKRKC
jgi:hypothetical protein